LRLRPRAAAAPVAGPSEGGVIGGGVGEIEDGAVEGEGVQAEEQGIGGGGGGEGLADAMEEGDQRARAEAVARLRDGALADAGGAGIGQAPAQALDEAEEDVGEGIGGGEVHGDAEQHDERGRQFARARLVRIAGVEHGGDRRTRHDLTEGIERQMGMEGGETVTRAYDEGHARTPCGKGW